MSNVTSRAAVEFSNLIYDTPHDSLPQLYTKMAEVTATLPIVGLEVALPFAQAYQEVTGRANLALEANAFTDAPTTVRLAGNFAGMYFTALASHATGNTVAAAWRQLFSAANQPPWVQLALGVNAHIGHDLPFALQTTAVAPEFHGSYLSLNQAIKSLAPQLAPALLPSLSDRPRDSVAATAANVIIRWRNQAWEHFMDLGAGTITPAAIEAKASRRGKRLQLVGRALGTLGLTGV